MRSKMLRHLADFGQSLFLWTFAATPLSPSIGALFLFGSQCFEPWQPGDISTGACLTRITVLAPIGVVFGGLSSDVDPRPILWPATVVTALTLGLLGAFGQLACGPKKA